MLPRMGILGTISLFISCASVSTVESFAPETPPAKELRRINIEARTHASGIHVAAVG